MNGGTETVALKFPSVVASQALLALDRELSPEHSAIAKMITLNLEKQYCEKLESLAEYFFGRTSELSDFSERTPEERATLRELFIVLQRKVEGERKRAEKERKRAEAEKRKAETAKEKDSHTKLWNRIAFMKRFKRQLCSRRGGWYALVFGDARDFRYWNNTHGHPAGSQVISIIADLFRRNVRRTRQNVHCRYAGDEFCALLKIAHPSEARAAIMRFQEECKGCNWTRVLGIEGLERSVDVDFGIVCFRISANDSERCNRALRFSADLMRMADELMYATKTGRANVLPAMRCVEIRGGEINQLDPLQVVLEGAAGFGPAASLVEVVQVCHPDIANQMAA
ncbi:MAG: diguanylate cyclase [bacterium]|nr:diguanylate cyclase [bacterium]